VAGQEDKTGIDEREVGLMEQMKKDKLVDVLFVAGLLVSFFMYILILTNRMASDSERNLSDLQLYCAASMTNLTNYCSLMTSTNSHIINCIWSSKIYGETGKYPLYTNGTEIKCGEGLA
jgi:hypothetical protein